MGCPRAGPAYQCLGAKGNPPGPLAFSAKAAGLPCPCKDRQYRGGGICQQTWRHGLPTSVQDCAQTVDMGIHAGAGSGECGGQPPLQERATSRELEVATRSGRDDLVLLRRAVADLFALRDNAHCPLLYSVGRDSPPLGTDTMAHQWSQGLLYAFQPSAQPAAEDRSGGGLCDPGGTRLGPHDMVLVGDTTPGRDTMETSSSPRPAEPSTGDPVSSLPSGAQSLGLAPERAGL